MRNILLAVAAAGLMASNAWANMPDKMERMDRNNDGIVTRSEFDTYHSDLFRQCDTNHDGKLDVKEHTDLSSRFGRYEKDNQVAGQQMHREDKPTSQDGSVS